MDDFLLFGDRVDRQRLQGEIQRFLEDTLDLRINLVQGAEEAPTS